MTIDNTSPTRTVTGSSKRRRFGRYETLFRIAGGGMAEVYAARILGEGGFEKVVALKRMLPTLAEDDRFVTMFLDEGRVAANISSPNVVQTLDLGRAEDDSLYLVMELVVGVPLARLLRQVLKSGEHMNTSIAAEILAQAASGLHDAHEATTPMGEPLHIIHRDVSPQNILVDRTGRTRILDFGVARAMQRSSHTQTGEVKGKMAYFAPEQATGATLDRRVDVFALGIVAWEVFSGRRLFKSDNPLHTLQKITQDPIPTLLDVRPTVSPKISVCIAKALRRDPQQRYETAREFAQALRDSVSERASPAQVGGYVQQHGGESLDKLETGLKIALSGNDEDIPISIGDSAGVERTPLSQSQIVASHTGTPVTADATTAPPVKRTQLIVGAAIALVAALIGGMAAFTFAGSDPADEPTPPPIVADSPTALPTARADPLPVQPARGSVEDPIDPVLETQLETQLEAQTETQLEAQTETQTETQAETQTETMQAETMQAETMQPRMRPSMRGVVSMADTDMSTTSTTEAMRTSTEMTDVTPEVDPDQGSSMMVLRGIGDFDSN